MKRYLNTFIFLTILLLADRKGYGQILGNSTPASISGHNDSLQYAMGAYLAKWVNKQGLLIDNPQVFLKGMDDVFRNQSRLFSDSLSAEMIEKLQYSNQLLVARKSEKKLFQSLRDKPGMGFLPEGIYYNILKNAEGQHPQKSDTVLIHIQGETADGIAFENTRSSGQPIKNAVKNMVPGVAAILPLMGIGMEWTVYIPAVMAYGDKPAPGIPPGSALVIKIELLNIIHPK